MLVVAGAINYVDRATLAVANLLIRDDLHLSIADMGYLLSAFLWAYAFAQLPTGAMVDKLGPRLLLTCGLSLWSFAQLLGGLVESFGQFFGARRNFRPAREWSGIGSIRATAASRRVSSIVRRPWAPRSLCLS
jgi:MFS family permease